VCALTLSPALAGVILRVHEAGKQPNILKRGIDRAFGALSHGYSRLVRVLVQPRVIFVSIAGFVGLSVAIVWVVERVPTGFVPDEDKGLLIAEVRMPVAASQSRTLEVVKRVESAFLACDGVNGCASFQGFSLIAGNGSNYGVVFAGLKPWSYRVPRGRDYQKMLGELRATFSKIQEGIVIAFYRPAVDGVGNAAGFDLRLQDRGGVGRDQMQQFVQELVATAAQTKLRPCKSYRAAVPRLYAGIDREGHSADCAAGRVRHAGRQPQLGLRTTSAVRRTWQVTTQAESRSSTAPIRCSSSEEQPWRDDPLGSMLKVGGWGRTA
jgi:multidrug efflux pump subunit AcrB